MTEQLDATGLFPADEPARAIWLADVIDDVIRRAEVDDQLYRFVNLGTAERHALAEQVSEANENWIDAPFVGLWTAQLMARIREDDSTPLGALLHTINSEILNGALQVYFHIIKQLQRASSILRAAPESSGPARVGDLVPNVEFCARLKYDFAAFQVIGQVSGGADAAELRFDVGKEIHSWRIEGSARSLCPKHIQDCQRFASSLLQAMVDSESAETNRFVRHELERRLVRARCALPGLLRYLELPAQQGVEIREQLLQLPPDPARTAILSARFLATVDAALDRFRESQEANTARTRPVELDEKPVAGAENRWRLRGQYYDVCYLGKEAGQFYSTRGFVVIEELLRSPDSSNPVSALELMGSHDRRGVGGRPDPIIDADARTRYRQQLAEYDREIAEASQQGDEPKAERLRNERQEVNCFLGAASGIAGMSRDLGPKSAPALALDAVRKALDRAYAALEEANPPLTTLAAHLRRSIFRDGYAYVYRPESHVEWLLD